MKPSSRAEDAKNTPDPRVDFCLVDSSVWIRADRKKEQELRERLKGFIVAGVAHICWPIHASVAIESTMTLWTVDSDFKRVEAITGLRVNWFGLT